MLRGAPAVLGARGVWELPWPPPRKGAKTSERAERARARAWRSTSRSTPSPTSCASRRALNPRGPTASCPPIALGAGGRTLERLLDARRDVDRNLDPQALVDVAFAALGDLAPPRAPAPRPGRGGGR